MKILVTGFEPFGGEAVNPAWEAVKLLPHHIGNNEIITAEIPVVRYRSLNMIADLIENVHPDAVISVGQAGGRKAISFERIGINCDDPDAAMEVAEKFQEAFDFAVKPGNSSNFAGSAVEVMKGPFLGKNGHIAIKTNKMEAGIAELEKRGFTVDMSTAKYKGDRLHAVYLKDEIGGFAVHLLQKY